MSNKTFISIKMSSPLDKANIEEFLKNYEPVPIDKLLDLSYDSVEIENSSENVLNKSIREDSSDRSDNVKKSDVKVNCDENQTETNVLNRTMCEDSQSASSDTDSNYDNPFFVSKRLSVSTQNNVPNCDFFVPANKNVLLDKNDGLNFQKTPKNISQFAKNDTNHSVTFPELNKSNLFENFPKSSHSDKNNPKVSQNRPKSPKTDSDQENEVPFENPFGVSKRLSFSSHTYSGKKNPFSFEKFDFKTPIRVKKSSPDQNTPLFQFKKVSNCQTSKIDRHFDNQNGGTTNKIFPELKFEKINIEKNQKPNKTSINNQNNPPVKESRLNFEKNEVEDLCKDRLNQLELEKLNKNTPKTVETHSVTPQTTQNDQKNFFCKPNFGKSQPENLGAKFEIYDTPNQKRDKKFEYLSYDDKNEGLSEKGNVQCNNKSDKKRFTPREEKGAKIECVKVHYGGISGDSQHKNFQDGRPEVHSKNLSPIIERSENEVKNKKIISPEWEENFKQNQITKENVRKLFEMDEQVENKMAVNQLPFKSSNKLDPIIEDRRNNENFIKPKVEGGRNKFGLLKEKSLVVKNRSYLIENKLGEGGTCQVFDCVEQESLQHFAIKIVNLAADAVTATGCINEVKMLKALQGSDYVIKIFDYEIINNTLFVVMEKGGIDLSVYLRKNKSSSLPLYVIKYLWLEMLHCVKEIHDAGIIHSDLKPSNFVIFDLRLKLIDFGIASRLSSDMTSIIKNVQVGTFNYISPEALLDSSAGNSPIRDDKPRIKISYKSDVWSLGCILYQLVYNSTPFHNIKNTYAKISMIIDPNHKIKYANVENVPLSIIEMIMKCLQYDMRKRPTVHELISMTIQQF